MIMTQSFMISMPLKATTEIDWVTPLKSYIRDTYGDDPELYAEECATLHRLRQDMRGAGKDSIPGRDMLYRYYGQLELLDLRFPVDEQHIKISFTWFDAFTHKPTTQYSLAFEKASVIFNIAAMLSHHGALQNRADESALKATYHCFQASAGMLTYINENFLHAPSFDLSRETVKTCIQIMLAQAQEVFLEKQVTDHKKIALLAKLAAQTAYVYAQAADGVQENVNKAIFEKAWLSMTQMKTHLFNSKAQYYQALADDEAGERGSAVSRLQAAQRLAKEAERVSKGFPASLPSNSSLSAETATTLQELSKRQHVIVQEKLRETAKNNDFVYHQTVPLEASLPPIVKLAAAKPIPVSELYTGQDFSRITGPDLFAKIVPMAVTESASLYDEEKAKLLRAETEKADTANGEMAASLDYLRLPGALQALKGGFDPEAHPDEEFRQWCVDVADHEEPGTIVEWLRMEKESIMAILDMSSKQLDMEESVCEKMRSKYEAEWSQQPSARLTTTLREDIRNYLTALKEAAMSDSQLIAKLRHNEDDFNKMRRAAKDGEADQLFQAAMTAASGQRAGVKSTPTDEPNLLDTDFSECEPSVAVQISRVEDILKKLNLVMKERAQVLKDLKEKVRNDDISQVLILNKKSISNYEAQLFEQELEKFRPHQNRLLQANQKQSTLMKELTSAFSMLLQDKRVRSEQSRFEAFQQQRSFVMNKYKRSYHEFLDLEAGLQSAKNWYIQMKEMVESLEKKVETFVLNRRSEGAQLLDQIEQDRSATHNSPEELRRERLQGLMERMSMKPALTEGPGLAPLLASSAGHGHQKQQQQQLQQQQRASYTGYSNSSATAFSQPTYDSSQYGPTPAVKSPPTTQASIGLVGLTGSTSSPPMQPSIKQTPHAHQTYQGYGSPPATMPGHGGYAAPPGFIPPPPPPGSPPLGPQQTIYYGKQEYEIPKSIEMQPQPQPRRKEQQESHDPWAGLSAWN